MTSDADVPFLDLGIQTRAVATDVRAALDRIMASGSFVGGGSVRRFERLFADHCGVEDCVGVANGTDAIELALRSVGLGRGDRVAIPANTFVATAEAVARVGATCVAIDCDDQYLLMDPERLDEACRQNAPDAVIAVDLHGQIAPIDDLAQVAGRHGAILIEDAAQSQGALQDGRGIGHGVAAATTSFYPGKNLGAFGDAGAIVSRSAPIIEQIRLLGDHGSRVKYEHEVIGMNSRLDSFQAEVLLAKLVHLERWNAERRAAADRYHELLDSVPGLVRPRTRPGNVHVWHLYCIRIPGRDPVATALGNAGIATGIHYPTPVHRTAAFRDSVELGSPDGCPVADRASAELLSLPMFPGITGAQQERVAEELRSALAIVNERPKTSEPLQPNR